MTHWYAWDAEYPEDGATIVKAPTREQAHAEAAVLLDTDGERIVVEPAAECIRCRGRGCEPCSYTGVRLPAGAQEG